MLSWCFDLDRGDERQHPAPRSSRLYLTLGIGPGETAIWNGQTVTGGDVLVKYTYAGDANLDGTITGDDYSAIDFNILAHGGPL